MYRDPIISSSLSPTPILQVIFCRKNGKHVYQSSRLIFFASYIYYLLESILNQKLFQKKILILVQNKRVRYNFFCYD